MQNLARSPDRIDAKLAAFAAAEYVVEAENEVIVIRVDEPTPDLDRLLDGRPWAVITAHNPDGRLRDADENAAAQRSLDERLRKLRPDVTMNACNRDPAGRWPDEPARLFTPESFDQADRLAARFGQRAIVTGLPGAPARLRIYAESPDAPGTAPGDVS